MLQWLEGLGIWGEELEACLTLFLKGRLAIDVIHFLPKSMLCLELHAHIIGPYTACYPKIGGAPAPPLACENYCPSKGRGGCMGFQDIPMKPYKPLHTHCLQVCVSFSFPFDIPSLGSCPYS